MTIKPKRGGWTQTNSTEWNHRDTDDNVDASIEYCDDVFEWYIWKIDTFEAIHEGKCDSLYKAKQEIYKRK